MGVEVPSAILFCCTYNAIRSPMAEGLFRRLHGTRAFVASVGIKSSEELDPFAVAAMDEVGIDISRHRPRTFDELEDECFDVIVSLSPEAQHTAVDMTRTNACEVEFWPTFDPSLAEGTREARLEAYRLVRDELDRRIRERFPPQSMARE